MNSDPIQRGPIAWMARNPVAAGLLMLLFIGGGLIAGSAVRQEVFPEADRAIVEVAVPYPGASAADVEQGVLLAVEEAARGLDGVKRVDSVAFEGLGIVRAELLLGADRNRALQEVRNAVDRIASLPREAERPVVSLVADRSEVISLVLYGDQNGAVLRALAERTRDELLQDREITRVELSGVRPPEIGIEVPQSALRAHHLTLDGIAREVARASVELPGGGVKTSAGELLLRTDERRDHGSEFADIPIVSAGDGAELRLGEIATVVDGFADTDERAFFNGKRAVMIHVFRAGDQTPIGVADAVLACVERLKETLPPGVQVATWLDWAELYRERRDLLFRNALIGLALVLVSLGLLMEGRLAFWVTAGIPTSIIGTLLFMPLLGVSVNMVSLFAFIMAVGMVVDNAIVVGESVHELRAGGMSPLRAAIAGTRQVATPVTFSALTTVAAFLPMCFVPGVSGKLFRVVPAVVVTALMISLVESLFILPAHLVRRAGRPPQGIGALVGRLRAFIGGRLDALIHQVYAPFLRAALRRRYLTAAIATALLLLTIGYVAGGRIGISLMPRVESDVAVAAAVLPVGAPVERTEAVQARLVEAAKQVLASHGGDRISRGIYTQVGSLAGLAGMTGEEPSIRGGHLASVMVHLVPSEEREITAAEFARLWRERTGEMVGLESLAFRYEVGLATGQPIDVALSHSDLAALEAAAAELAATLRTYAGVVGVDDGYALGKPQLDLKLRPEARSLGITAADLARQVRGAFFGAEAVREQRGRDELKVMVRLPESERASEGSIDDLVIRTPLGGEVALHDAATVTRGRAHTEIRRAEGRRVLHVTADVEPGVANARKVLGDLKTGALSQLAAAHPGLRFSFEGEQREMGDALGSLKIGFAIALVAIFALLAIPLGSYLQPLIVMSAIPFGIVGAVAGHVLMGCELSLISVMGIIALSGVVVNDSLVFIDASNRSRRGGLGAFDAATGAGMRRFRPILLTSVTTFLGLAPMIYNTSTQARFLVPIAISLGYGILFSTAITLILVPALCLILEDFRRSRAPALGLEHPAERRAESAWTLVNH